MVEMKDESRIQSKAEAEQRKTGAAGLSLFAAVVSMFFIIAAMLLSSFQIVIYGDPSYRFYEKEYVKYSVTDSLDMKIEDVMEVTEYMMDYLIGKEEELSIVTDVDGEIQDFFNEQDRLHMEDVKNLFLGGLKLRTVCIVAAVVLIIGLAAAKTDWKRLLPKAYIGAIVILTALIVFLAVAFTINFTACFRIFHEMFFTNDLWMFDPATDYMIRMLPEGFFSDMVIRIGLTFIGMLLAPGAVFLLLKRFAFFGEN